MARKKRTKTRGFQEHQWRNSLTFFHEDLRPGNPLYDGASTMVFRTNECDAANSKLVLVNHDGHFALLNNSNRAVQFVYVDEAFVKQFHASSEESLLKQFKTMQKKTRAAGVLDSWAALLPQRVVNEEIGDYLEDIRRRAAEGQRLNIGVRVISAIFWTALNAAGYALKMIGRKRGA